MAILGAIVKLENGELDQVEVRKCAKSAVGKVRGKLCDEGPRVLFVCEVQGPRGRAVTPSSEVGQKSTSYTHVDLDQCSNQQDASHYERQTWPVGTQEALGRVHC